MPTHFGPSLGPRQGPGGQRYKLERSSRQKILSASFAVSAQQIEPYLPPGFSLPAEPVLSLDYAEISEIEWLAGRGYNTFGVAVTAICEGQTETVNGNLLLVLWENMADPIITGREDLGFSKVYCELPPLRVEPARVSAEASWDGHCFARMRASGGVEIDPAELPASDSDGTLHYKYIPKTGAVGEADVAYPVLTPAGVPNYTVERALQFSAVDCEFIESTWEQLPTLVNVVNALAEIDLGHCTGGTLVETRGYKDLSDQRPIR
ncbi:MAG: acetoacetate decarboxylase family protein [Pseudomonadota bacterium]